MNERSVLEDLTIVVLSYRRPRFAERLMRYWSERGPTLLVLDGSPEAIPDVSLVNLGANVRYLHRPVTYRERLRGAIELVETEFVVGLPDDEFFVPSALAEAIGHLRANAQLVSCGGVCMNFLPGPDWVEGELNYARLFGHVIDGASPRSRVATHMRRYVTSQYYSVARTVQWRIAWEHITRREFGFFASMELEYEMCMAYAGPSRNLPVLFWLRSEGEASPIRGTVGDASLDPAIRMPDWLADPDRDAERAEFRELLADAFQALAGGGRAEALDAIADAERGYSDFFADWNAGRGREDIERVETRFGALPHMTIREASRRYRALGIEVDGPALAEIEGVVRDFHPRPSLRRRLVAPLKRIRPLRRLVQRVRRVLPA